MSKTLESDALVVLRGLFDLAEADVCPTLDLMARLWGIETGPCFALITQLRELELVQADRLALTMRGLAVAVAISSHELRPMAVPVASSRAA